MKKLSEIKIGAKLDVAKICKLHFEFVKNQTIQKKDGEGVSSLAAGKNSVLACFNGRCRAGLNSLIAIANHKWNGNDYEVADFKARIVDGKKIKADTWYKLVNGEFVEVDDDES
jgi:hypothetical protein